MSTARLPPTDAAQSKAGWRRIRRTRRKVAAWRKQAELIRARYGAVADEKCRRSSTSREWPAAAATGWIALASAAALAAFVAGGTPAGWCAASKRRRASDLTRFTADALEAYRLYVVEVRHPVEVPGDQRPHLVEWLSKRLGSPLLRAATRQDGIEAGRRPAAARPDRSDGVLHVRGTVGRALHALLRAHQRSGDRIALHIGRSERGLLLGRPEYRLCAQRSGGARQAARDRASRLRPDRHAHAARQGG